MTTAARRARQLAPILSALGLAACGGGGEGGRGGTDAHTSISSDGRYVAFDSDDPNLVAGHTNGFADVFVRDTKAGSVVRASVSSQGAEADGDSADPSISSDGRYVAFASTATNLVGGDSNGLTDVFVHDVWTGATTRVSVDSSGREANGWSAIPSISADGRYVVFESEATNLVVGDGNDQTDVIVHDCWTGGTWPVSRGVAAALVATGSAASAADAGGA